MTALSEDRLAFFPGIAEHLAAYVYLLVDPRDGQIFYVGKGRGDRAWHHARGTGVGSAKLDRIRAIQDSGHQVRVEVLRHGLSDAVAHSVEAAVIDALRLTGADLTNLVAGHNSHEHGWLPLEELRARYGAEPMDPDPSDRIVLIRINRAYRPGMSDEEIYTATRQWWRMDPKAKRPDVALGVFNGVVRRAYRIDPEGWERDPTSGRWRFSGAREDVLSERYEWRNVSEFVAAGAQNPITYVHCTAQGAGSPGALETGESDAPSPQSSIEAEDRVAMIRINQDFRPNMSEQELYEATRQWWRMAPERRQPQLAFAVWRGVVQRVYAITPDSWEQEPERGRWRFSGTPADDAGARYEGMDVSDRFAKGSQNPITYVNCD